MSFMATENILWAAVAAGGDRQELHEKIRQHSQAAAAIVKQQGGENDLIARLKSDDAFHGVDIDAAVDPAKLTGRSKEQVDEFLSEIVEPIRRRYRSTGANAELRV
jgi:adenylosuccinate lyase